MFELCMLAITFGADPTAIPAGDRCVAMRAATIARPAATIAQPHPACACLLAIDQDAQVASVWLKRWEQATCNVRESVRSRREEFRRKVHEQFNEHTAAAVELMLGGVKESILTESFDWRIAEKNGDQVCLEAIPLDPVERLFYRALKVSLDATNGTVQTIVVVSRNQVQRIVWQAESEADDGRLQLVQFEDIVPPAPSTTFRTSDSRFEERR